MIIGKGNISSVLTDREDVVFFASGVSDSTCIDEAKFKREVDLIMTIRKDSHIVYFSSLGVFRWDSAYMSHKRNMEQIVKDNFNSYTIIRVEVIAWGKNPNTIHNYFRKKIANNEPVSIQDTHRYVVTEGEFKYWLDFIPVGSKSEINIPGT